MVDRAKEYGFEIPEEYRSAMEEWWASGDRWTPTEETDAAVNDQGGLSDMATDYLTENAPEGFTFVWDAGELSMMSVEDAEIFGHFG